MEEAKHICVYSGSAHPELSQQIANYLGISLGKVHLTHFPDGEYFVQYSYGPDGASTALGNAPKDGMLVSVILLGSTQIPFDHVDDSQLDELLGQFPNVHMIMTDCPAQLITALEQRGLR